MSQQGGKGRDYRKNTQRAWVWRGARLQYVQGAPTLGEVMDACKAEGAAECDEKWKAHAVELGEAWSEWLAAPGQFISDDMLYAMSAMLKLAGVELSETDARDR